MIGSSRLAVVGWKERASDEKRQNVPVIKQQVFTAVYMLVP